MSLPESMSRVVVVGTKSRMEEAIEAFYSVRALHLIDHTSGTDNMSIGTPMPTNQKAAERLLKVRAMEKELGIGEKTETARVSVGEIKSQISSGSVESIEAEVLKVLDVRSDLNQRITELNAKKKSLELLTPIPVDLELYRGYKSLAVIVGSVKEDPSEALKTLADSEAFVSYKKKEGGVAAVFVRAGDKDKATSILSEYGLVEIQVPEGKGPVSEAVVLASEGLADLSAKLESVEKEAEALQMKHKAVLRASEEELSIEIEKGEVPLRIAVGEYSYIMDAWVPTSKVQYVSTELESRLGNDVHVEFEETRGRNLHEEEKAEERFKKVPTKNNNGAIAKEFEYATSLVSTPKYQEIDPSILIMFFLPLFFGFMIGDCGYAIPFIILGAYGLKVTHHKDWRAIATVLFFGGIWAFLFGFFFFGEALGMHFIGHWEPPLHMTWEGLLGVHMPDWFGALMVNGHGVSKLGEEVGMLLKLTIYIGIIHIFIGYMCGFLNIRRQHNNKHAFFEKGGWIITFVGMVVLCYALTQMLFSKLPLEGTLLYILAAGAAMLLVGLVVNFKTEGIMAILELPGIVGMILSYARLAAIGMSKAGMAMAFNYIAFGMIMGMGDAVVWPSIGMLILGLVLFAGLHLVVWTLGILSAGLHALRLQFVELMTKFFAGGGIKYEPLKVKRIRTILTQAETNKEV
ncbi:MAG: V-type ATP synthase subunit I [Candidatus Methanoplasma sp.]|jgi:V/A-type H+-transporting ATPase subunit I|nr:V-type ATP synthase subunit I [Candidatus Methanoplasma sp.]